MSGIYLTSQSHTGEKWLSYTLAFISGKSVYCARKPHFIRAKVIIFDSFSHSPVFNVLNLVLVTPVLSTPAHILVYK